MREVFGARDDAAEIFKMPTSQPIGASGSHDEKRPRPLPRRIKQACLLMIYGPDDTDDAVPLDFVQAARRAGVKPVALRKWLHKPITVAFIRRERAAFRMSINAASEYALRKVRDHSLNGMSVVAATKTLLEMDDVDPRRRPSPQESNFVTIRIVSAPAPALPTPMKTIEHVSAELEPAAVLEPAPAERRDASGHRIGPDGQWCFDPDYRR